MKKDRLRAGIALIAALMLALLAPSALAEALEEEALDASAALALEEMGPEAYYEPEVPLAQDAGDTGLVVEYEDERPLEWADGLEQPPEGEWPAEDQVAAPDEDAADPAFPQARVGYAAMAPQTVVYADGDLALAVGAFPEGAVVYAEAVERDGALLKIRFDTVEARSLARDIPVGYALFEDALCYDQEETEALERRLSADAGTRYLGGVAIPCVTYEAQDYGVMAGLNTVGLGVAYRSPEEIQAFANANPAYRNQLNLYSVAASDAPYTLGKLSPVNQQSALNMINQIRYIAGINADVSPLYEQEDAMAAASLVLRLNGALSHYPARPAAMADPGYDALYQQAYVAAGHANIAMGYTATGSLLAYMADSDDGNIATVGHRRWIINPRLGRTVMGANGRFSAMYAHDLSGSGAQTRVAWPAQEMPLQYFSATDPWSVSFGKALDITQVQVDLVRARDNRSWHFSQVQSDGYFNVENNSYGLPGCVIFRPNGLEGLAIDDLFFVAITDGAGGEITYYTVHFFSLDLSAANPMEALSVTAVKVPGGNAVNWNAVGGATGYYVCRRTENSNYQIVADVNDVAYWDADVAEDQTYYYQVYAHNASVSSRSAVSVQARPIPPESVTLNASGKVSTYLPLQLTATLQPAGASAALTWRSSKERVAVVDENGLVTPVRKGTTIISVQTDNGLSASVKVKVVSAPKPKKVLLSASGTLLMIPGQTLQLAAQVQPEDAPGEISWSSSRSGVAAVSEGLVTALGEGKATITARAVNGKKARVKVRVVDPYRPEKIVLNYSGKITLRVGEALKLDAALIPATAQTTLSWTSSRPLVAAVDGEGNVAALKKGSATVTVRTANGKKARVRIKVVE